MAYNGTQYSGWQIQPSDPTIQSETEKALSLALRTHVSVYGSGRTDAGVHARGQVAHFDYGQIITEDQLKRLRRSLNGLLPNDIYVKEIRAVPEHFHARFDAHYRTYHYYFSESHQPLHSDTTAFFAAPLNAAAMHEAASYIHGDLNCLSFTPFDPQLPHHRCWFFESRFLPPDADGRFCYVISANRFLRNLVRSIMGTLVSVGKGRISPEAFLELFKNPDRNKAGATAPAKGLVLHEVGYDGRWKLPGQQQHAAKS